MRKTPVFAAAALLLLLAGCASGPQTIVSETPATDVGDISELVEKIEAIGYECEFDQHDQTVGATQSGLCTISEGDVYISVFDDPAKQQKVASNDDQVDKGDASLQGGNWYMFGPDVVLENLYDKGTGSTIVTASGRFCDEDGVMKWCP